MTVQFLEQLWPLGCMSVFTAPEQMCQPKSMNFVRKMYVGTRIPSVETHGLARGFSQQNNIQKLSDEICQENLKQKEKLPVRYLVGYCEHIG